MVSLILVICLIVFLTRKFLDRHKPLVGGKLGRLRAAPTVTELPDGFSNVTLREITQFGARSNSARYPSLKIFLRHGIFERTGLMRIYRVAGCKTHIEITPTPPDYERIDAAEALALLRELPDPRLIHRLHLSDEPSFLDPWIRQVSGREVQHLGNATSTGIIVLYRPDRGHRRDLGVTLLHEWLHLVAFKSGRTLRQFERTHAIEPLAPMTFPTLSLGRQMLNYETWSDLGERVVGFEEAVAQQAAFAAPLHSMILWQRIESIFRKVPKDLASTRLVELEARAAFMHNEVLPKARAAGMTSM
jgi:hypothetical protein